jgi:hypothetical protein
MTVSWRRSAEDVEPVPSAVPQRAQNLLPSIFSALQFGQTILYL